MLDVSLALVPRGREQGLMIGLCQVRSQQRDRGQRDRAIGQELENDRKPSGCARRLDAVIGRVLGQVQDLRAIGEQRGTPLAEIEPARVELREQRKKIGRRPLFIASRSACGSEQLRVGHR